MFISRVSADPPQEMSADTKTASSTAPAAVTADSKGPYELPDHSKHAEELLFTARTMATKGKGLLAADEPADFQACRFSPHGIANTRENRQLYRTLLFTAKDVNQYLSGVIVSEDTLIEKTIDGKSDLISLLLKQKIVVGVKADDVSSCLYAYRLPSFLYSL